MKNKFRRILTWKNCNNEDETISIDEYLSEMKKYGNEKSKTRRSARKYLRTLGLILNKNGNIIGKK